MKNIFKKVDALICSDMRMEHSEFQMENFIIGGQGGDAWSKYRQVLRELACRHPEMQNQAARIVKMRADISREKTRWFRNENKADQIKRDYKSALIIFKSKAREYFFFYRLAKELKSDIGKITPERRRAFELNSWVEKARRMAAVDLISINGLQRSTVEFIMSFPRELRRDILADLRPENRQKLLSVLD